MEFFEVIRRQRMTRRFKARCVAPDVLRTVLAAGQKAPSAGFAQGSAMLVLVDEKRDLFWRLVDPLGRRPPEARAPVIILPLANKSAYLRRYAEPDKAGTGLSREENWPAPYWIIDCAFASMAILLAATAAGLGCWFFGIFTGKDELLAQLEVPGDYEPIGAIAIGYPASNNVRSRSIRRGRKPFEEFAIFPAGTRGQVLSGASSG